MMVHTNRRKDVTKDTLLNWYLEKTVQYGWEPNGTVSNTTDGFKMPIKSTDSNSSIRAMIWVYGSNANGWAIRILYGGKS